MNRLNPVSSPAAASVSNLLLGAMTVMFGLQLMRTLIVDMAVYLTQVRDVSSILVGVMGLAIFSCGLLEPLVRRLFGRSALPAVIIGLGAVRLAEQTVSHPPIDLGLSIAGTVLFLWSLPLLFRSIGTAGQGNSAHAVVAILLGLSADTAVKGIFGTIDPSWVDGIAGHTVVIGLVMLQQLLLVQMVRRLAFGGSEEREEGCTGTGLAYLALGPALFLEILLFQNVPQQTVLIGWQQPWVFAWVLAVNLIGAAVAVQLAQRYKALPWPILALLGVLLIAMVADDRSGAQAALIVLAGHVVIAVALVSVIRNTGESPSGVSAWIGVSMIVLLALLFFYYASYDTDVLLPKELVRPLAALLIGLAALRAGMAPRTGGAAVTRYASVPALLLLILPLVHLAAWKEVSPVAGDGLPVRVMSYNLHQGFDVHGRHGMEAMARVIEAESPDIVALQEVSRGWAVNGSVDMLVWLSQRLEMDYVWGPATDAVWGNAVLSRFPIAEYQNHEMPNNDTIRLDRAFLTAKIDLGGGEVLDVVATHFHSGDGDSALRVPQARAVLEAVDSSRTTVLLGDLNAPPGDPEILLIASAGLRDAFVASGATGDGFTSRADSPRRRIDYVWASPDLKASDFSTHASLASDHFAVAVTLSR